MQQMLDDERREGANRIVNQQNSEGKTQRERK